MSTLTRTEALRVLTVAGAGFALGVDLAPRATAAAAGDFAPSVWVKMHADGTTTVVVNEMELGQGVTTGLPMMLADELDLPMASVAWEPSPIAPAYDNPSPRGGIWTDGSKSTPTMGPVMRTAGATARAMLIAAAAQRWGVDAKTCTTASGVVRGPGGRRAAYPELFDLAATLPVPATVALKSPAQYTIMGTRQPRLDLREKSNGRAIYGIDATVPGMKFASIERPPQLGATVASFDATDARAFPGVRAVVQVSAGVAVVADTTWAAFEGRKRLKVTYAPGPNAGVTTDSIFAEALGLVRSPGVLQKKIGDTTEALNNAVMVNATYSTPYLAHAAMEPLNATADVRPDGVTLWLSTQTPTDAQKLAAQIAGVPLERVVVHPLFAGGAFGRRGHVDFVRDAVEVSKAIGVPIKVTWTREDDMRNDFYRPGTVSALRGAVASDGTILALEHVMACSPVSTARMAGGLDPSTVRYMADLGYTIPNLTTSWHRLSAQIPVGFWRAPYANANAFPTESFVDELAAAAQKDPVAFRLAMLAPGSPARTVLERVAALAAWGAPLPAGHAHGVAMGQYNDAWIAVVAEISMPGGALVVHKLTASGDVGEPTNLDTLDQQMTGAMIYGLSAALEGRITFDDGVPQQKNFPDYPVVRMAQSPEFVIDIVRTARPATGAGEFALPPVAPAIGNAIFTLSGKRIRSLPFSAATA